MSAGHGKKRGIRLPQADDHIDLVPLIDCVFLILLFFILVGRLSVDQRAEQITVPPTKTAVKFDETKGKWGREVINVFGVTQGPPKSEDPPRNTIKLGQYTFTQQGVNDYSGYQKLRDLLNQTYDRAEKYEDPKIKGLMLPKVIVEIRADADAEYRLIQEIQQVLTDTMDLTTMQPKKGGFDVKTAKPFVNLDFTTRKTTDRM